MNAWVESKKNRFVCVRIVLSNSLFPDINYVQYLQLELLEAQPGLLDFQVPPRKLHLTVNIKNIKAVNYFCIYL